ncbi:glutamyl-tRNA reductase [Ferruginibacter sp.]|uniref:glutamyl-tRNA reductase n=3 Tax=Ferruginibacter sp. TaxID=1940288 RepID=UPI00265ADE9D|nr:glutamyl-tRNA reductase [Ferruginibacter sp.]
MPAQQHTDISTFFIAGINYKKSDAIIRGQYAINPDQYTALLAEAPQYGIKELFILSTCNRTEIYGFAQSAQELCELLCSQTQGSVENFTSLAYIKNGRKAIEHLFDVAAGLDSQILGDYEIIGQIKKAFKFSKEQGFVGPYLERIVNGVLQSSKIIKNTTGLSGGTVSVSFAAIQYIKENVPQLDDKKILLLGTGKIGRNTCKNLVDYLGARNITLINRTENKAAELAAELGLQFAPMEALAKQIEEAAIILVATNSAQPVILESHVINGTDKLIIDLSIPYNVEAAAHLLPNVTLINVDELSKIKDLTLQKREAEIPKAKAIIAEHINEFLNWHQMRKNVPVLKAMKIKLEQMHSCNLFINTLYADITSPRNVGAEEKIQKVINGMAVKMRNQNQRGCHYIEAINEYIA